jgi:hypothetical protein
VVGTPVVQPFLAGQLNQFTMVDPTSVAIPGSIVNTVETRPYQQPTGFASLSIRFDTPFGFDPAPYEPNQPGNAHGEKLFFQPHLFVYQTPTYEIGPGNPLMLVVPFLTWEWPEERVAIWRAYPDVTPGNISSNPKVPPEFPNGWFENFNNCVYDGVMCSAPAAGASAPTLLPYPAP